MIYRRQYEVAAKQWKGDNLPEMIAFLESYTGRMAEELGVHNEEDSYVIGGVPHSCNVLLFYAWNDEQEVDRGCWIVIEIDDNGQPARQGRIYTRVDFDEAKFVEKQDESC